MLGIDLQIWLTLLVILATLIYVGWETVKLFRRKKRAKKCAGCAIGNCPRRE